TRLARRPPRGRRAAASVASTWTDHRSGGADPARPVDQERSGRLAEDRGQRADPGSDRVRNVLADGGCVLETRAAAPAYAGASSGVRPHPRAGPAPRARPTAAERTVGSG